MEGLTTADSIGVAVAGYGYWGANLARNVVAAMSTRLVGIIGSDDERKTAAKHTHTEVGGVNG